MVSIKLKFRASTKECKEGVLFFQIIHNRTVRRIKAGYHIYPREWDNKNNNILISNTSDSRHEYLNSIQNDIKWKQKRFENLIKEIETKNTLLMILSMPFRERQKTVKAYLITCTDKYNILRISEETVVVKR